MVEGAEYRLRSIARLHWASWHDEYVVFEETSGQTHQLDAARAFVLQLLSEAPGTLSTFARELSINSAFSIADATALLQVIIGEFQAVGLVEVTEQ